MNQLFFDGGSEYSKLDSIDKRLFFYVMENEEESIYFWVDFVCSCYEKKGVMLDNEKFRSEVKKLQLFLDKSIVVPKTQGAA